MAPKNKLILKRAVAILTPIIIAAGLSCFFFIDFKPEEFNMQQWKTSIISWVVGYGGTLLLSIKTILFVFDISRRIAKRSNISNVNQPSNTIPLPHDKKPSKKSLKHSIDDIVFHSATNNEEYLRLKREMGEYLEKVRKELKI